MRTHASQGLQHGVRMRYARRLLLTSVLAVLALPAGNALRAAQDFHTTPAYWDAPRVFHAGPPSAEFANRLHLIEVPGAATPAGELMASPDGATRLWARNPDTTQPGPWGAALIVDAPGAPRRSLLIEDVGAPIAPRWLNERLIFLRIAWGRAVFSDVILDTRSGTLRYHEQAHDGRNAFDQYQAICRGACPCDPEAAMNPDDPSRFSVEAPPPAARPGARSMIGLLLLPNIFGPPETGGVIPADDPQPLAVYAAPDPKAEPALRLSELAHFEYREYTYEGAAAVVYEQRPGWYAISLREQSLTRGWVRAADAGEFLPLARLLPNRLAYLNAHWDGHLWSQPAGGQRTAQVSRLVEGHAPDASDEHAVNILEARSIGDGLWLHVETLEHSPCNGGTPNVVDRGWIPAYAASGELVAGYYSRGC